MSYSPAKRRNSWPLNDLEKKYDELLDEYHKQQPQISALSADKVVLRNENLDLAIRNGELKSQTIKQQIQILELSGKDDDIEDLRNTVLNYRAELEEVKQQSMFLHDRGGEQDQAVIIQDLMVEVETLRAQLDSVASIDSYVEQIAMMQEHTENLEAKLAVASSQLANKDPDTSPSHHVTSLTPKVAEMPDEVDQTDDTSTEGSKKKSEKYSLMLEMDLKQQMEAYTTLWHKFERSEEKLQHCGEQRQTLENKARNLRNFNEHLQNRLQDMDAEKQGDCKGKCKDLEEKLRRLLNCFGMHRRAEKEMIDEVMHEFTGDLDGGGDDYDDESVVVDCESCDGEEGGQKRRGD
ncbi:hypothetical protein P153DRAFT_392413 [Dothidotthia symphoricarpi CBS 119687]|uniref:Uncharacterized protein n=1 Tax=Dothidotthia symphoricarpi CBS 119687 TaxID=1392245 RepID=A0A6A6APB1_9PLEO|nr:uncharacterized protein P153DRAFT_392413 [Dothidotthia symphoricarpi CBS 119687]KAF2133759.1 hypothetical protein P153DRAFT_392413 [Dothidotthia symphoricarpi CBS 119687]